MVHLWTCLLVSYILHLNHAILTKWKIAFSHRENQHSYVYMNVCDVLYSRQYSNLSSKRIEKRPKCFHVQRIILNVFNYIKATNSNSVCLINLIKNVCSNTTIFRSLSLLHTLYTFSKSKRICAKRTRNSVSASMQFSKWIQMYFSVSHFI